MTKMEFTSMSSRGQVVIPRDIRKQMGIGDGTKFMVFCDGDNLLMKPLLTPNMTTFKNLIRESHNYARKAGLKRSDVKRAIRKVRRAGSA